MARFKMIHLDVGGEVQAWFLCVHCSVSLGGQGHLTGDESSFSAAPVGKFGHNRWRQAGECSRCSGTGFDPSPLPAKITICRDCGGTSLCPHCGGNYLRRWEELPVETQESFLKTWQRDGTYPESYMQSAPPYNNPRP